MSVCNDRSHATMCSCWPERYLWFEVDLMIVLLSGVDFFLRQYVNYEGLSVMFATNRWINRSMLYVIFEKKYADKYNNKEFYNMNTILTWLARHMEP